MKTTIDGAGRLIIPKSIRDVLGLVDGMTVDVALRDGTVVIEPVATPMRLVRRGKHMVAEPESELPPLTTADVRAALEAGRR